MLLAFLVTLPVMPSAAAEDSGLVVAQVVYEGPVPLPVIDNDNGTDPRPEDPVQNPIPMLLGVVRCIRESVEDYAAALPPEGTPIDWANAPEDVVDGIRNGTEDYLTAVQNCLEDTGPIVTCTVPATLLAPGWLAPILPDPNKVIEEKHAHMVIPWAKVQGFSVLGQRMIIDIDVNGGASC